MYPLHPLFAISIFLIAFSTGYVIQRIAKPVETTARYQSIDGLRGFLALSVFIHHASIWHHYLATKGIWIAPESNLYNQLGQTGVTLFFMITSFLFVSKLLNTNEGEFDWHYFFRSRLVRLAPMYYFSVILIILICMTITQWTLNVSFSEFFSSVFSWVIFTVNKQDLINNFQNTNFVNAGVVWSLPCEWLFYFTLPIIGLFVLRKKPSAFFILISVVFVVNFFNQHWLTSDVVYSFVGGAIAPVLNKYSKFFKRWSTSLPASIIVLVCFFSIGLFFTTNDIVCKLIIIVLFTLVAGGNTVFGLLKSSTLKLLGDISYSTYLLHGIILFVVFCFLIGLDTVVAYSPLKYCMVVFAITPLVVVISYLGFRLIEKPFMNRFNKRK